VLRKATFEETAFLAIEFDQVADILGSNVLLPTCDFGGNKLQPLAIGSKIDVLTFSMIATSANSGAAVFVWHKQHDRACRAFVESLRKLPESEIPHALVGLAFSFCENSYFSPVWWSGLSSATKKTLEDRFLKGHEGTRQPKPRR
jgi:hypothetical protein